MKKNILRVSVILIYKSIVSKFHESNKREGLEYNLKAHREHSRGCRLPGGEERGCSGCPSEGLMSTQG